jgi:hypothetical protein
MNILSALRRTNPLTQMALMSIAALGAASVVFADPPDAQGNSPIAKQPEPSSAAGPGVRLVDDPKLLAPLPPPPPGSAEPSADPRNFEGIYLADRLPGQPGPFNAPRAPYTSDAQLREAHRMEMLRKGTPVATLQVLCRPSPAVALGADLFPAEVIQTAKQVVILNEEGRSVWQIFLNRGHPKHLKPTYWGDSVGHWDGNTLVVDIVGFNGKEWMQSKQAHVTARIRKIENGRRLEMKTITVDPENYTSPYERTTITTWHPELHMLEYECEENPVGAKEGSVVE